MSAYSDNLWADTLGIDLEELRRESPVHPDQIHLRRKITRQAEEYWARERFLARVEYRSQTIFPETPQPEPEKVPKKRAKVRRYEFTEEQLEIARRSLNASGAGSARIKQYESTEQQLQIAMRVLNEKGAV
jgi:hypothetical protein